MPHRGLCALNVFTAELRKFHSDPRYRKVLILTELSTLKMSVLELLDGDECPPKGSQASNSSPRWEIYTHGVQFKVFQMVISS